MERLKGIARDVGLTFGRPGAELEVTGLSLSFGGLAALEDVNFRVRKGELLGLIGPNGAGKSCLLNCISGFYRPQKGRIIFEGRDVTRLSSYRIAQLGIARTFQQTELYRGLSVLNNLLAARHLYIKSGLLSQALYFGPARREEEQHRQVVEEIIDFLDLEGIRKSQAGSLGYGLQQRVGLGRALALEPSFLLLDEPLAGMSTEEKRDMCKYILDTNWLFGTTVVLVEHDMQAVMDIVDRIVVLDFGRKIAEGSPGQIVTDRRVIEAYLGKETV